MPVCKICGHNYVSKECMKCKNKRVFGNEIVEKKNNKKSYINIVLIFFLLISLTATGMMYLKIKETIAHNKNQARVIQKLEFDNSEIKNRLKKNEDLITRYQNNAKELAHENARLKRNRDTSASKPKSYSKAIEQKQIYIKPSIHRKSKTNTTSKTYTSTKRYTSYSGYKKLVSDSKITTRKDRRLKSNAPIYARYNNRAYNIDCNIKQNLYKVVDECKGNILYAHGEIYLSKSNAHAIKNFNSSTHMIECQYNQQHGLMHDCKVKLKSI